MTMMTPVTSHPRGTDPSLPVTAIPPIRPVADAAGSATDDPGRDRPDDDRGRGSETTLRYKFDWLVQRQVRAGTIDPDEAAEMIRLFDRTIAPPKANRDADAGTETPAEERETPARGPAAATALLDRMRERFGMDGPYDDGGGQTPSTPAGMIVDEQL